jgi:putative DNA primase/helicase
LDNGLFSLNRFSFQQEKQMMYQQKMKARDIAPNRWRLILAKAGIDAAYLTKTETACPCCGGKSRFVFYDREGKGTWYCRYCGSGDGFQLLQLYLNLDFHSAAKFVEDWYYGESVEVRNSLPPPTPSNELTPEEIIKRKAKHKAMWEASKPVTEGDPVWLYLHNRVPGLNSDFISRMIRFHPAQEYWVKDGDKMKKVGTFPCMITMILAPDGTCQDIHRTYLTADGQKAPVEEPKKTLATINIKGGAIRLMKPTGNVLAVAEGIETSYAVMMFKGLPCWALSNTSGMKNFEIPQGIEYLHIFADNDKPNEKGVRAGFDTAQKLKAKAEGKGIKVTVHAPTKVGTDMLDLLVGIAAKEAVAA